MKKLTGKSSLSLDNVPQKHQKMGLIESPKYANKSFSLTTECIDILETLAKRYSQETGMRFPASKVVELAIRGVKDMTLQELLSFQSNSSQS